LVLGSDWLVSASVTTARALGINELIIGLTIIAVGTSLPEIATSVMAAVRGKRDIATGNVIGSNLFNLLFVGGTGAILTPGGLTVNRQAIGFDLPVMLAATIACLPIFYRGYRIDRWEGWVFIFYYVAYVAFLILATIRHEALPVFNTAILYFALPLTTLTVIVLAWRWYRRPRV
jgi:cation:H+ antiporter